MQTKNSWVIFAVSAGLCWGVWGVLSKLVADDVSPYMNHVLFTIGMLATLPLIVKKCKRENFTKSGLIWGLIAGLFATIGNVAVYKAFTSGGLASIVIPVTNLYPLITTIIAVVVLKERLNSLNVIGIFLAIPAILLLSGEPMLFMDPLTFISELGLNTWFLLSIGALISWGIFSVFQKITTNHIPAEWSYATFIIASAIISIGFLLLGSWQGNLTQGTLTLGVISGAINGLGVLTSFVAYRAEGKASAVTTIAGTMQPLFTILLAVLFLKEEISWLEGIGMTLAIVGALLLSYEKKPDVELV